MPAFLRALKHRNYRLYFVGQVVSLVGTWMQHVAMSWLAYRLTDSVLVLGLVGFAGQIPVLLLAPFGGLWSDHFDRRRLLIATQVAAMIQAIVLAALTLAHAVAAWQLVLLALILGAINAVDIPARQALLVQLVDDRGDLPNAIALNSMAMNGARLVGPSLAGVMVSWVGEGICFLLNALSYLTVLLALLAVRSAPRLPPVAGAALSALRQGFVYAFGTPGIRSLLVVVAAVSFTVTPYTVLMPVFAREIYGGDARTLGLLLGWAGGGALAGTIYLAARQSLDGLVRVMGMAPLLAGVALIVFAASRSLWIALPALLAVGFGVITTAASGNTLIQSRVRDDLRGRVMSIYVMSFLGIAPLGSLAAGALANAIGAPWTLTLGGAGCIAAGVAFQRRRRGGAELVHSRRSKRTDSSGEQG